MVCGVEPILRRPIRPRATSTARIDNASACSTSSCDAREHLFAFGRQYQPLAHPVEQPQADFLLEGLKLSR